MSVKLFPQQTEAFTSKSKYTLACAGIQGGKTYCGAVWLLDQISRDPTADYFLAAPTFKVLQSSTLRKFLSLMPSNWGVYKQQLSVVQLCGGGNIFIRSLDDPDSIEGITARAGWIDEAGKIKEQAWINCRARVSHYDGPIFLTTTPYVRNWLYYDFLKRSNEGDPDFGVYQWRSIDNPHFAKKEWKRAEQTLDNATFKRRYCGLFTKMVGLVYQDFDTSNMVKPFKVPDTWERFGGIDFGYPAPTAVVFIARSKMDGTYYVYDEHYQGRMVPSQHAVYIKQRLGVSRYYADPSSPQNIFELQKEGIRNIFPADHDIKPGVQKVVELIRTNQLKIFKSCRNLLDEISTYHYPEGSGRTENEDVPVGIDDHACDALRYALYSYHEPRKLKRENHYKRPVDSATGY